MPVTYARNCKVCNSKYRGLIESMHVDKASLTMILEHLQDNYDDVDISMRSLRRHFLNHFKLTRDDLDRTLEDSPYKGDNKVEKTLRDSHALFDKLVEDRINDLKKLDDIINKNYDLHLKLTVQIENIIESYKKRKERLEKGNPDYPVYLKFDKGLTTIHGKTAEEVRQAIKVKLEIMGMDDSQEDKKKIKNLVDFVAAFGDEADEEND